MIGVTVPRPTAWPRPLPWNPKIDGATVKVEDGWFRDGGAQLRVEFNPSRIVDPEGVSIATVEKGNAALDDVLTEIGIGPLDPDDVNMTRLDVAKDFDGVRYGPQLIASIVQQPHDARWQVGGEVLPDGTWGSMWAGSDGQFAKLYDKGAESLLAPPGRYRFEVRARGKAKRGWLELHEIVTAADVTRERAEALARWGFDHANLGTPVIVRDGIARRVSNMANWSPAKKSSFLGDLCMLQEGLLARSTTRRRAFRRECEEVGVVIARGIAGPTPEGRFVARLDYDTAREIAADDREREESRRSLDELLAENDAG
jgi:hypothetical protein